MRVFYSLMVFLALMLGACETFSPTETAELRETACLGFPSEYPIDVGDKKICTENTCLKYLAIWTDLLKEKNSLAQDFIDAHIQIQRTSIRNWKKGISFRVCYTIQFDWAIAYQCDKFIIHIDPSNSQYPAIPLPRNVDLTKAQIKLAVDNGAFSSAISTISNTSDIQYATFEDTMNDLVEYAGVNTLCFNKISLDKHDGSLVFEAHAAYIDEDNSCISGTLNLKTGEKKVQDTPCHF